MTEVRLRALLQEDLDVLTAHQTPEDDPWNHPHIGPVNDLHRRFGEDGGLGEHHGILAVVDGADRLVGSVSWHPVRHGPAAADLAYNVGISLFPDARGRGLGTEAQRLLATELFAGRLVERLEAETAVDNLAEQRALEKAGFVREGVLRHAQYRAGGWHDVVLYSRLRSDAPPPAP